MADTTSHPEGALAKAGWFYALIPVIGAGLWLITGDLEDERNRSPLELTQFAELAFIFIAIRAGLSRSFVTGGLSGVQKIALALVGLSFAASLLLTAPEPFAALERAGMRVPHLLAAIGVCFLLGRLSQPAAGRFTAIFLWQPLIYVPLLALLYLTYIDEPRMNWLGGPLGFWHVRVWGSVLAAGVATALGLHASLWGARWQSDLALFAALVVLLTLLAWSGSRASILGLMLSYLLALMVIGGRLWRGLPIAVLAAVLGVLLSLQLQNPHSSYGLLNSVAETAGASLNESSGGRMVLWRGALDLIAQQPLIGHGFDQFRYVYTGEPEGTIQPHNAILQLLVDFGVPGGLAAIFLLLSFWWRGVSDCRSQPWKLPAVMTVNALAVIALFDGALYHAEPLAIISICLGILLARPRPA